jgi:hypothetical protein
MACPSIEIGHVIATEKKNVALNHQGVDRFILFMPPPQLPADSLACRGSSSKPPVQERRLRRLKLPGRR